MKTKASLFTRHIVSLAAVLLVSTLSLMANTVSEVTTYSALKALNPAASDNVITVRYRSSVGDGGGGLFFWDSTDTTTADNDGTVLISTYTPAPSGRWKRIYDGQLNVRWFGALPRVGSTISDDSAAMQKALDLAGSLGQELYFPPGIYDMSSGTSPFYLNVHSNTKITLDPGAEIAVTPTASINYYVFYLSGVTNVVISGGVLTGDRTWPSQIYPAYGIALLAGCKDITIRDVLARSFNLDGIFVGDAERVTVQNCTVFNNRRNGISVTGGSKIRFVGCTAISNGLANGTYGGFLPDEGTDVEPNSGYSVSDVVFESCTFGGNAASGLTLRRGFGNSVERVRAYGCAFLTNGVHGFYALGAAQSTVENSISQGNHNEGFMLDTTTNIILNGVVAQQNSEGISSSVPTSLSIFSSTIADNTSGGISIGGNQGTSTRFTGVQIVGNIVRNNGTATGAEGIKLTYGAGATVSDNLISTNFGSGLLVEGDDFLITGNRLVANGHDPRFRSTTASGLVDSAAIEMAPANFSTTIGATHSTITKNFIRRSERWDSGKPTAVTSTSITLASTAGGTTDYYLGQTIEILSGTAAGQTNKITAYNGTTHVATLQNSWGAALDSVYQVRDPAVEHYSIRIRTGVTATTVEDNDIDPGETYLDASATSSSITTYFSGRGAGDPNGVIPAVIGSRYYRTDGGPSAVLYIKESGTSPAWTDGWRAVGATFSSMTGATAANTINNGNYGQTWNWALTTAGGTGMTIGENSASTGTGTALLEVKTLSGSTAIPLIARAGNVGQPVFQLTSDDGTGYTPPTDTVFHGRTFTSTSSTTTMLSINVPDNTLISVRARIRARSTTGNGALYVIEGAYKRSGGTVTVVGSGPTKTVQQEDVAAWDATLAISGTSIAVNVVGENAVNTTWHGTIEASYVDQ